MISTDPEFRFLDRDDIRHSWLDVWKSKLRMRIGGAIDYFYGAYTKRRALQDAYNVWMARSPGDRLSNAEIDLYLDGEITGGPLTPEQKADGEYLETFVKKSWQGQVLPLLEALFARDKNIRSVMNIGVYAAFFDYYLAEKHPEIQFFGLDFHKDLLAVAHPVPENLSLVRGYALDLIEEGKAIADVVFFSSTAYKIKNAELRRYMKALSAFAKYVVFNEPVFPMPTGMTLSPDRVDPFASVPVVLHPAFFGDKAGGLPPGLVHNYRAIVSEHFDALHFSTKHNPGGAPSVCQVIARNRSYKPAF